MPKNYLTKEMIDKQREEFLAYEFPGGDWFVNWIKQLWGQDVG